MTRRNNPVLGTIACNECGGQATVHQTQRGKGRYLYTRCTECGPDQKTGAAFQRRLWSGTDWRPDAEPVPPPGLEEQPRQVDHPVSVKPTGEPDPLVAPEPDKPTPEPRKPGLGAVALLSGAVGLLIAIARS